LRHQIDEQKEWCQNRDTIWNKNEQDAQQTKLEMTAKLDYLAGRFKTLHEKLKETNENIVGMQNKVQQWNAAQTSQLEQLLLQVNDQERTLEQTKASMTSMLGDVMGDLGDGSNIMKQITTLHENYSELVVLYNQLNTSLSTATIHKAGNSYENVVDNKEETHHRFEQVTTQLEHILQQVQCLETNQDQMKEQQAQLYQEQATLTDALMVQWNNGVDSTDENPTMPDVDHKPGLDIHPHRAMTKTKHQNIICFLNEVKLQREQLLLSQHAPLSMTMTSTDPSKLSHGKFSTIGDGELIHVNSDKNDKPSDDIIVGGGIIATMQEEDEETRDDMEC
jgi:hypothetical protein